jgi:hypothetical protein
MKKLSLTEAFRKYGGKLRNPRWAYSDITEDRNMVLSCWNHIIEPQSDGSYLYRVKYGEFTANPNGRELLRKHVSQAYNDRLVVRMVLVVTKERAPVIAGIDCSRLSKAFHVCDDQIGEVVESTSEHFLIRFRKVSG